MEKVSASQLLEMPGWSEDAKINLRAEFRKLGLLDAPKLTVEENLLRLPQSQIAFLNYFRKAVLTQVEFDNLLGYLTARGMFTKPSGIISVIRSKIIEGANDLGLRLKPALFTSAEIAFSVVDPQDTQGGSSNAPEAKTPPRVSTPDVTSPDDAGQGHKQSSSSNHGVNPPVTPPVSPDKGKGSTTSGNDSDRKLRIERMISDAVAQALREERVLPLPKSTFIAQTLGVSTDDIDIVNREVLKRYDADTSSINPNALVYEPITMDNVKKYGLLASHDWTDDKDVKLGVPSSTLIRHNNLEGSGQYLEPTRSARIREILKRQLYLDLSDALVKLPKDKRLAFKEGRWNVDLAKV